MNLEGIEPLAAMGIALLDSDAEHTRFRIPLNGNRNDKGTLFAGSQYSALVLAGWYHASEWARRRGLSEKVAIKDCQVRYPSPAESDLTVTAVFEAEPDQRPSGHWRARVRVTACDETGEPTAELTGDYRILI